MPQTPVASTNNSAIPVIKMGCHRSLVLRVNFAVSITDFLLFRPPDCSTTFCRMASTRDSDSILNGWFYNLTTWSALLRQSVVLAQEFSPIKLKIDVREFSTPLVCEEIDDHSRHTCTQ